MVKVDAGVSLMLLRSASVDAALVIVMVYVWVAAPSVTTVVMVFCPTVNGMAADAVPDVTAVPFTVIVAAPSLAVGVTVMDVVALVSLAV